MRKEYDAGTAPAAMQHAHEVLARADGGSWRGDSFPPHEWTWGTTALADGERALHVQAKDGAERYTSKHAGLPVDNTPPGAEIVQPDDGVIVLLGATVQVDATDAARGVARVAFYLDGEDRAEHEAPQWQWQYNTFLETGFRDIAVRAWDHAGNTADDQVRVLVLT